MRRPFLLADMPAQPGRFSLRKPQVWTSDQQINSGWLGPRACQEYSEKWVKEFSGTTEVKYSHFLMQSVDQELINKIECALDLLHMYLGPGVGPFFPFLGLGSPFQPP